MKRLLTGMYTFALCLLAILSFPRLAYAYCFKKKYTKSLTARLGKQACPSFASKNGSIWIHAVSVGETRAVAPLVRLIKEHYPTLPIVITSVTETGHAEAKRSIPEAAAHLYMPFDFQCLVKPLLKAISPGIVILTESDFWWNFLSLSKQAGAALVLVNGKLSARSAERFRSVPFFSKPLFSFLDKACVQNALYQSRFVQAGLLPEKLLVTGNIKFDDASSAESGQLLEGFKKKLGIVDGDLVLTLGSTHFPEEKTLLRAIRPLWEQEPRLKVLIVPRHPERFKEVALLLKDEPVPSMIFSNHAESRGKERLILIDQMGLLRGCYQLSALAFVGGSLFPGVGGHNILEPCVFGVPVLFGPCMEAQQELASLVLEAGAGFQIDPNTIEAHFLFLLKRPEEMSRAGRCGLGLMQKLKGAAQKTLNALKPALDQIVKTSENSIALK